MAVTPIATVADVKAYAGISTTNTDAVLAILLAGMIDAIGSYCNRDFTSAQRYEYRNGNGSKKMQLVGYPVTAVNAVSIDGVSIPPSVNGSSGFSFIPQGRILMLPGGYKQFTEGDRNVYIDYVGGYGDAAGKAPWPDDLKLACIMMVVTRLRERDRLGVGSKSLAGETVSFTDGTSGTSSGSMGIPAAARLILNTYMNVVPESGY
jgi:hypothetical protein